MKNRLYFLTYAILMLTGIAEAQSGINLKEHRQLLLYAFIGLSAFLVILVLWEILDTLSKGGKKTVTTPQVNIVGTVEEAPTDEEDPIKALLKKQAEVISSNDEEELPAFLKESGKESELPVKEPRLSDTMPETTVQGASPRIPESHADADPFKALLMQSAKKEPTQKSQERDETIEPTIPLARVKGKGLKRDADDPFKSLLKSKREEKDSTGMPSEEASLPLRKAAPQEGKKTRIEISVPKKVSPDKPSGVEVKIPKIKGLKSSPLSGEKKKVSLSPPQPAEKSDKKISFSLPGKKKSRGVGRLFSRLSEAKKEEENLPLKKPSVGVIKPTISSEALEKSAEVEQEKPGTPDKGKIVLKIPGRSSEPKKPKVLELKVDSKKGPMKDTPSGKVPAFRQAENKKPIPEKTKRLRLDLASPGKKESNDNESGKLAGSGDNKSLFKTRGKKKPARPKPTKIFRQIPKPASTKMLRPDFGTGKPEE